MKRRANPEFQLHCAAVELLRRCYPDLLWFHIPNGEARDKRTAGRLKAMGVRRGVADLAFVLARPAYIELKARGRNPSKAQLDFRDAVEERGGLWGVCYSIEQMLECLGRWGIRPRKTFRLGSMTVRADGCEIGAAGMSPMAGRFNRPPGAAPIRR